MVEAQATFLEDFEVETAGFLVQASPPLGFDDDEAAAVAAPLFLVELTILSGYD